MTSVFGEDFLARIKIMPIFGHKEMIPLKRVPIQVSIFTVRKRSLRRLCFYTCLSFCSRGRGSPGPYPKGRLRCLAGGVSRPIPRGEVEGFGRGGLQAHIQGGRLGASGWGVCIPACTEAEPPSPVQQTATAADGTHPTGIHSKATLFVFAFFPIKNFHLSLVTWV